MKATIPGTPIAKKRPRFARRGNFVKVYNEQESEESRWLWEVKQQIGQIEPLTGPVTLLCEFHMPIPKSASKKQSDAMMFGRVAHTKKPDLDNMVKFVKDCLNEYAWRDDSQVIMLSAVKRYSNQPKTEITITEVENGKS